MFSITKETADLVTFAEENCNGKLIILCRDAKPTWENVFIKIAVLETCFEKNTKESAG